MSIIKLSKIARCIKQLELIKWDLMLENPKFSFKMTGNSMPKEYYLINEFPFCSAFCYVFRDYRKKKCKGKFCCFCPRSKFITNSSFSCNSNSSGKSKITVQIIDEVNSIPITTIMKYLSKISIESKPSKISHLSSLWNFSVKFYSEEWLQAEDSSTKAVGI